MKNLKSKFITVLILNSICCIGQNENINNKEQILILKVELITNLNNTQLPGYCGDNYWEMTFEYKIISIIQGIYTKTTILINQPCPREAVGNKSIENNKVYTVKLKKIIQIKPNNDDDDDDDDDVERIEYEKI